MRCANALVSIGEIELMSTTVLPLDNPAATPPSPNKTRSTSGVSGNIKKTISARCATSVAFAHRTAQVLAILDEVGSDNLFVQYDIYHAQRMEGELAATLARHLARIAHVQLADNPGRNEPGTGEINYAFLFAHLDRIGYKGWIGCEYKPATTTEAGLGWLKAARG